jgi:hypothetical protein
MAVYTAVPAKTDPRWRDVVSGKIVKPWQMLALKIMITRFITSIKADPSPANIQARVDEIHAFFEKNLKLAQADLTAIFG